MPRILLHGFLLSLALPLCGGCDDGDGSRTNAIVFVRQTADSSREVWMMRLDGTDKVLMASRASGDVIQGLLSPDGRTLLYLTNVGLTEMVAQDLSTWAATVLITSANTNNDMTPAYSPDGTRIAYSLSEDRDIHLMDADGTDSVTIASDPDLTYISPSWNGDGTRIVYMRDWDYGSIWTMNPDGTGQALVKAEDDAFAYRHPSFLPDGRILCCRVDVANGNQLDIVVMDIDGTDEINLTPDTLDTSEFFPTANDKGNKIAYAVQDFPGDGELFRDIYIADFNGTALSNATNLTADVDDRCWRPKLGYVDESYLSIPE